MKCQWEHLDSQEQCGKPATFYGPDTHDYGFCNEHAPMIGKKLEKIPVEGSDRSHVEQLRQEINNVILRWGDESDLNVVETLGVLEICKLDFVERVKASKD